MTKYFFVSLLISTTVMAGEGSFFCKSEMMKPYKEFQKAYIQSSCEKVKRYIWEDRLQKKANVECSKWATGIGISKYHTEFYTGGDHYHKCRLAARAISDDLKNKKMNIVQSLVNSSKFAGGSKIMWTSFLVDNFKEQKAIYEKDGAEQAQWIEYEGEKYCGYVDSDIAFLEVGKDYKVINPSTGEVGYYKWNESERYHDTIETIAGIESDYLTYDLRQYGPSFMEFFNVADDGKVTTRRYEIFYSEYRKDCK